ncbi:hypothetical protein PMAYCL1PPCAC_00095 [Pristionchus mayeri]|uniref:C2H2-type domain-containing protein n=1 Tax=Pristionchus mayeri TaxID=1317129 RepID=A0AAN5C416_9BILA|nr:hypothetical protein PMAYCL1PPCAC_00095 [Pristionchus mayeri]
MNSGIVKCPECPYNKARNLGTHLFFVHGYSKNRIAEWRMNMKADTLSRAPDLYDIFRCGFCPKTYRRQNSMRAHERVVHCVTLNNRQKCVPCPIRNCQFTTTALLDLCAHAKESHPDKGDYSIKEARFDNFTLFQAWRLQYEDSTHTVLATESVNNNAAAGTTLRYLRCAQLEAQIRKMRNQIKKAEAQGGVEEQSEYDEDNERQVKGGQTNESVRRSSVRDTIRLVRKRKVASSEELFIGKEHEGCGIVLKKEKDEKEQRHRGESDEEEIDVEQLDEEKPSCSASVTTAVRSPILSCEDSKSDDQTPSLLRASRDSGVLQHGDNDASTESEIEKRLSTKHCTAHMRVLVLRSGAVHVEYCESHLGHDLIPMPSDRSSHRRSERTMKIRSSSVISREAEEDIERAKQRRKGRRETEHRWKTERKMRTERDEFTQLCDRYDDIGANVELYEAVEDGLYGDDELSVEEVIEEVDHEEMVTSKKNIVFGTG